MAILDGLKNAVAANTARAANNVAVNGLRNIVGDVFGVDLNPTNPAAKLENRTTKFSTKSLAYPADVEGDDMQGHYIIFEILTQTKSKLKSTKGNARIAELQRKLDEDFPNKSPQRDRAVKALQEATAEHMTQNSSKYANTSHQSLQM